ncbi:hypothetical protein H6P81_020565 [Aristolochia fimbriata]|uniref:Uncharacterized protein n=1 Tax=Aristolochia fimbriata TaxID=158543 RepID=A0AAV7DUU2_ARIFI|nr:hypothetical protein H6P81_020565 [Aristolochia fimbriata]
MGTSLGASTKHFVLVVLIAIFVVSASRLPTVSSISSTPTAEANEETKVNNGQQSHEGPTLVTHHRFHGFKIPRGIFDLTDDNKPSKEGPHH